jgi:peptide/nickel transport system substrate-binding protein
MNQLYAVDLAWPAWATYAVYQPLVGVNISAEFKSNDIQYLPGLAVNWSESSDGTTYTLNLRQNVTFSDGDAFNAYQAWAQLYGFYYLSGNSSTWLENYQLFNMSNVSFGPSTLATLHQSGLVDPSQTVLTMMRNSSWPIYVTGPYQIVFHLQAPFEWFLGTLISFDGLMFDTQYVLDHGGFGTPASVNSYFDNNAIPGTGPYTIDDVVTNSYVKFTQNPGYWGRSLTQADVAANPILDPGHAATVYIYYKPDDLSRFTDLSSGAAQISVIGSANWNSILSDPSTYSYLTMPPWGGLITIMPIQTQVYPTNITDVRQAIVHAINYTDIIKIALLGQGTTFQGPEYPAWKQFYDLGNASYSYNVTLAEQYLKQANITKMPALSLRVESSCEYCVDTAQIVQSDLSDIGLTVNIQVLQSSAWNAPYGNYTTNVQDASQIGQLSIVPLYAPNALTPADNWVAMVSNGSLWGNFAAYSNPIVQACVNAFTDSANITSLQSLCTKAQNQINADAPYAWIALNNLWYGDGSLVWNKNVISGFYADPLWTGQDTAPIINTITFA